MIIFTFRELLAAFTVCWIVFRCIAAAVSRKVSWIYELKLLTVFFTIVFILRVVYFPWQLVNGEIRELIFLRSEVFPFKLNLIPFVHMTDQYDGWERNLFGNILLFVPVGMAWPFCFKKLDTVGKTVLAGAGLSLMIELSQLLFYGRTTDVDDLILNTAGTLIGAVIYFAVDRRRKRTAETFSDT